MREYPDRRSGAVRPSARRLLIPVLLAFVCAIPLLDRPVRAQEDDEETEEVTLTFSVQSFHENVVSLKFYSRDRDIVWPDDEEVYLLDDSEVHEFTLACEPGEQICYGAWVRGEGETTWGCGQDCDEDCEECCYIADDSETPVIRLNP